MTTITATGGETITVASVDEALRNAIDAAARLEREGRPVANVWAYVDRLLETRMAVQA